MTVLGSLTAPRRLVVGQAPTLTPANHPGPPAVHVQYVSGDRFDITIRSHTFTVDQPRDSGGEDLGPTPLALFVASLASCVAHYARRYLSRHKIDAGGLSVDASYRLASNPTRVGDVSIALHLPSDLPADGRDRLLAVARHCTVHNSIVNPPEIRIDLT